MRIRSLLRPRTAWAFGLAAVIAAALATAGLAGGNGKANAKQGGTINVLSAGDVDFIDPGQVYYSFSFLIAYATQRPLLSYKPNSVTGIPDLAASMPTVAKDGKSITVHIRKGVRFSPPVNREVTSADVKYAIERGFASSVSNGYASAYFGNIVGAPKKATKGVPNISGIQTPDKYTLVFKLTTPFGVFVQALGLPLTAPVPADYARPHDSKTRSDYGMYQVSTGPYMIQNDSSGKLTGYQPNKQIVLVRNPNWDAKTSWRPAYADKVVFKEGFTDPTVMTKQILSGTADVNGDSPPPPAELRSILSNPSQKKQLVFTPTGGSRYVPLNTQKPPFNNVWTRRAVAYVLDRRAMLLTRGGPIDGRIATHFIDPSFANQGFKQAGGYKFNPFKTPNNAGSVAKAKAMLKKAGYKNGVYTGPQLTMVADSTPPGSDTAKVVAADLAKIGMKVKTISVLHSTMYTKYCNVPKNEPDICPNVGWLPDFREPQTLLDPTFNGKYILPVNNSNWPLQNDPKLNKLMDQAEKILEPQARYAAWGKIDQLLTKNAVAIPWVWENYPTLFSTRVSHAPELWNSGGPDVTFMKVK